jgi:hypothetical protein
MSMPQQASAEAGTVMIPLLSSPGSSFRGADILDDFRLKAEAIIKSVCAEALFFNRGIILIWDCSYLGPVFFLGQYGNPWEIIVKAVRSRTLYMIVDYYL